MSSTIKAAILALKGRVADAYTAIQTKGGTLPATQDSVNLPAAIASIPSGIVDKVKLFGHPSFTNLLYESMGEQALGSIGSLSFDSVCSGCENMKVFDLRGIEIRNGVSSWWNRTSFAYCHNLEELYLNNEDLGKTTPGYGSFELMFYEDTKLRVIRVGSWCNLSIDIRQAGAMTRETIVDFLNDLPTPADANQVITMGTSKLNLLTAEDRAIATNKGWSLS